MSLESPSWNNRQDRELYEKLFYESKEKKLSEKEKQFCTIMYHLEECACGLDG